MKIAIFDDYQSVVETLDCFRTLDGHEITVLHQPIDPAQPPQAVVEAEVLVLLRERTPVTEAFLERLPRLRLISQTGPIPHIDLQACTRRGVLVSAALTSTRPGVPPGSRATAELTWALILASTRRLFQDAEALKRGAWQTTIGTMVYGKTLGILGYGRIGALVAGYGRAFGMRVLVWSREGGAARARADGFDVVAQREQLFRESDVLSLHQVLVSETRGSVDPARLALMKPTSILVNTSRAGLIAPGALEAALKAGRPGFAALDVFDREPVLGASDPLLALPNTLCTPHLGYVEREAYEDLYGRAFAQVAAYAAGKPTEVRNPEVTGAGNR